MLNVILSKIISILSTEEDCDLVLDNRTITSIIAIILRKLNFFMISHRFDYELSTSDSIDLPGKIDWEFISRSIYSYLVGLLSSFSTLIAGCCSAQMPRNLWNHYGNDFQTVMRLWQSTQLTGEIPESLHYIILREKWKGKRLWELLHISFLKCSFSMLWDDMCHARTGLSFIQAQNVRLRWDVNWNLKIERAVSFVWRPWRELES